MRAVQAPFPALGADTVAPVSTAVAAGLLARGLRFVVRYLGSLTVPELDDLLAAGQLVSLVTYADQWDGPATVAQLRALGIPAGVTVWLDVEGLGPSVTPERVTQAVNDWAAAVAAGGWQPGLYVGAVVPLTAVQLFSLAVTRYWRSMSLVTEPRCGYCMTQFQRTVEIAGEDVDVDAVHYDYEGRLPTFVGSE